MTCETKTYKSGFTFERLEALEAAIAEGILKVKYSDKEIWYNSVDDMLKARDIARQALGLKKRCGDKGIFGGSKINPIHSKGLE